jgi:hypothetical protein
MVYTTISASVFYGHYIAHIFNDTDDALVALGTAADATYFGIRNGVTFAAKGGVVSQIQ